MSDSPEKTILSASVKDQLPLTIKQILDENKDVPTKQPDKEYEKQIQSLNSKYLERVIYNKRGLISGIGKLVSFMATSISAELRAAKASELLTMVSTLFLRKKCIVF